MSNFFGAILIILVIYLLAKKGIIKNAKFPIIKYSYRYKQGRKKLDIAYKKFNGIDKYPFRVKKDEELTIQYNVTVKGGSLIFKIIDGNHIVWEEEFTEDNQGQFTFMPNSRTQFISLIGNFTKGGCQVEFFEENTP